MRTDKDHCAWSAEPVAEPAAEAVADDCANGHQDQRWRDFSRPQTVVEHQERRQVEHGRVEDRSLQQICQQHIAEQRHTQDFGIGLVQAAAGMRRPTMGEGEVH